MSEVWFCHQCEAQIDPLSVDGLNICPTCGSDFLESVTADDLPSQNHDHDGWQYGIPPEPEHYHDEDPQYDLPGAFPADHQLDPHPSPTAAGRRQSAGPLFRFGMGGGSITIGGGTQWGGSGRRSGHGAGGLRTSNEDGVPTLSEFLSNSFGPARARTYDGYGPPPSAGGPSRSRTLPAGEGGGRGSGRQEQPAGDLMDIMNNLLGILAERSPRNGRLSPADDPYLQMLRSQGGLGSLFFGSGGRGSFGDYATSEEAFDRIVTQLAEAAGDGGRDRPPAATSSMIDSLPNIPIDPVLLRGLDQKDCTICMSDFEAGEQGKKMPCTHLFHRHCLETWLETNGSCPVCRHRLDGAPSSPSRSSSTPVGQVSLPSSPPTAERGTEGDLPPAAAVPDGTSASISGRTDRVEGHADGLRTRGAAAGTGTSARAREGQEGEERWLMNLD